ncbi:ROK family glucokinase [Enterococcus casseliflavus]|uniref:ROK family glucokinase n=1 Tax=Enterococcus casseliflavus TaxID=37734 RepID=UPI0039A6BDF9
MENYYLGIDLGGTTTKFGLVTTKGRLKKEWWIPTDCRQNGTRIIPDCLASIQKELASELKQKRILGIGMGCPGAVDRVHGTVSNAFNLGWTHVQPIRAAFEQSLCLPFFLENDANAAALGEKWQGSGDGEKDVVFLTLGTGVGGGVILNDQLVTGVGGAGGEIGHFPVTNPHSFDCSCGNSSCLETLVSATGIVKLAESYRLTTATTLNDCPKLTSAIIFAEAKKGDLLALKVVNEAANYLGQACSMIANLLNPHSIIIGGGVAEAKDFLMDRVRARFEQGNFPAVRKTTKLKRALLGKDAGIFGAAYLVKIRNSAG